MTKGLWTKGEEEEIKKLEILYGRKWSLISKVIKSRSGKQIRDRFLNYLDPLSNRNKFTEEEDNTLITLYKEKGPKWSEFSMMLIGRTGDSIKNRFYSTLKKRVHYQEISKIRKKEKTINQHFKIVELNNQNKVDCMNHNVINDFMNINVSNDIIKEVQIFPNFNLYNKIETNNKNFVNHSRLIFNYQNNGVLEGFYNLNSLISLDCNWFKQS